MKTTIATVIATLLSANALATQHIAPGGMPATPAPTTATAPMPAATGTVARAQFTSGVQDREPLDALTSLTNDKTQVYFYTDLKGFAGSKVTHRWEYKGQLMAEIPYDVGAARWRVWSSKTLDPLWTGEWKVSVMDASGATLAVQTLSYNPAAAVSEPAAPKQ